MDFLTGVEIIVTPNGTTAFLNPDILNLFDHYINGDDIIIIGPTKDRFDGLDDYQPTVTSYLRGEKCRLLPVK